MKLLLPASLLAALSLTACNAPEEKQSTNRLQGTWQLISGTLIEKGDTTVTDHTRGERMIKIINGDHFAFLRHDLAGGKDTTALYSSGGGRYTLEGDQYTEHLEFCSDRAWENHSFSFTVTIHQDTLVQQGIEKIEEAGIERLNIEKYVRLK